MTRARGTSSNASSVRPRRSRPAWLPSRAAGGIGPGQPMLRLPSDAAGAAATICDPARRVADAQSRAVVWLPDGRPMRRRAWWR